MRHYIADTQVFREKNTLLFFPFLIQESSIAQDIFGKNKEQLPFIFSDRLVWAKTFWLRKSVKK